jgi:hypothetical protein
MYTPAASASRASAPSATRHDALAPSPAADVARAGLKEGKVKRSRKHLRDNQKQIGVAGLLSGRGQQGVRLAAVMGLMVEKMGDEEPLRGTNLALSGAAEPHQILIQPDLIDLAGPA